LYRNVVNKINSQQGFTPTKRGPHDTLIKRAY